MPAKKKTSGVYSIVNLTNSKEYVGSSVGIENRWLQHRYKLNLGKHHSPHLQHSWTKYGQDAFELRIIEECEPTKELLIEREQLYIDALKPAYNYNPTAGSRLGSKASEATKAKMSASMKGKNVGKVRSAKTRALLSDIARNMSEETRAKIGAHRLGTTLSEDTRAKMSAAHTGRAKDPAAIAKMQATKAAALRETREQIESTKPKWTVASRRKFTDDQIREIRSSPDSDTACAQRLGVSQSIISRIRRRAAYGDVI
jgi:group I intron endonuclease